MTLPIIRRVVTAHDTSGKAIIKIDETCSHYREGRPGANICNVWTTDSAPANNSGQSDDGKREGKFTTIENGSIFRIIEFKPGVEERVHRTNTIDYIVVMSGEIDMELESGNEVHLKAGDVMVQRGTVHNWINRGSEPCILAVILIHSKPVEVEGKALTAFG